MDHHNESAASRHEDGTGGGNNVIMNPSLPVNSDYNGEALFGHRSDNSQSGIPKNVLQPDIVVNRYTFHISFTQRETQSVQQNIRSSTVPNPSSGDELPDYSDYFRNLAGESSGITHPTQHKDTVSRNDSTVRTVDSHLVPSKRHRMDHAFSPQATMSSQHDETMVYSDSTSSDDEWIPNVRRGVPAHRSGRIERPKKHTLIPQGRVPIPMNPKKSLPGVSTPTPNQPRSTLDQQSSSGTFSGKCTQCFLLPPDCLLNCKHLYCRPCCQSMYDNKEPCPRCGARFRSWQKVYLS